MVNKVFLIFLLSVIFSSCVFFIRDNSRAGHPVMSDTSAVVYVKTKGIDKTINTYSIGAGSIPIWCDVDEKYASFLLEPSTSKKMFAACYSGKKPILQENQLPSKNIITKQSEQRSGTFSIEDFFNPFSRAYIFSVSITPSRYEDFFVFYFDLYRKFCQKDGISCCMTGNGNDYKFSMVVEEPENVKQFYMEIDSVVAYMNSSHNDYKDVATLYGLFSSTMYDKCSFNRWYYDAISAGLVSPELFMNFEKWNQLENKTMWPRVKRIDVKLIDYQKVPLEDKKWLEGSLKNLSERF